jgi:transcriptional antiterminator RfaH
MSWYLIHTKVRQEKCALENLERQGYTCYLPMIASEKIHHGNITIVDEALFPRYMFVQLDISNTTQSWSPIRSTKGVSRLVSFGNEPAKVDDQLIAHLKQQTNLNQQTRRLFQPGERLKFISGAFANLDCIYQMADGESRAIVLLELLSKPVKVSIAPSTLRKLA